MNIEITQNMNKVFLKLNKENMMQRKKQSSIRKTC